MVGFPASFLQEAEGCQPVLSGSGLSRMMQIQPTSATMIAPLPPYKRRTPWELVRVGILIGVILTPAIAKIHFEQRSKAQTLAEYRSTRALVLARIDAAVANYDLETLSRIHNRYVDTVQDNEFRDLINAGIAQLIARETRMELTASRNLDLSRNREEASNRTDTSRPQLPPGIDQGQTLSVLPY